MQEHKQMPHERVIEASKMQVIAFECSLREELAERNPGWAAIIPLFQELLNKAEQAVQINEFQERNYFTNCLQVFLQIEETRFKREISPKKYSSSHQAELILQHQKGVEEYFQHLISAYLALAEQIYWARQMCAISQGQHEKLLQTLRVTCDKFEARASHLDTMEISELIKLQMEMGAVESSHHVLAESLRDVSVADIASLYNQAKASWEQGEQALSKILTKASHQHSVEEAGMSVKTSFNSLDQPEDIKNEVSQWTWYFQVLFTHCKEKVNTQLTDYIYAQEQQQRQQESSQQAQPIKDKSTDKLTKVKKPSPGFWEALCCVSDSAEKEDSPVVQSVADSSPSAQGFFAKSPHVPVVAVEERPHFRRVPKGVMTAPFSD